jgi:DNA-binding winged helix-turn-helix (wHTH) protein/predicted ATPase
MKYFLSYRFDESCGTIWRGARVVDTTRKAGSVLGCLVERAGATVPHDVILSCVWPDAHVHPDNIKVLVRELRRALGDDAHAPRVIRSDPGRGYAFIAPVSDTPQPLADGHDGAAPSAFVNHGDNVARLADMLADAERSQCRLVVVEGERGLGKTTLCDAFVRYARAIPSVRVCYGQSLEQAGRAEPYFPIVDALDHLARQLPETVPRVLNRHAPAWLALMPAWISDMAPLAEPVALPESSRLIRDLSELLETFASETTTVIVLDDLHRGDVETIEVLRGLARRHARLRTLIVATYAPFESTLAGTALRNLVSEMGPAGRCVPIRLRPLNEEQLRAHLSQRFRSHSIEALARPLHRLTAGNPLAVASAIDALVAADFLVLDGDRWRSRYSPRTLERSLPDTILDAVFWRFDQLGPEDRVMLEIAAAVGIEFSAEEVTGAGGLDSPVVVARRLDLLHTRGFISRRSMERRMAHGARPIYRFLHPLHAEMLATHAPVFQQLRAAGRLAGAPAIGRLA